MAAITVTDPSHPSHLVEGFGAMREAGELFDYVIRGRDDSFSIHSLVLASMSPVFKAMLTSSLDEAEKKEATFPTIPDGIMRKIINYSYAGTCTFSRDELTPLIEAAHFLSMSNLLKFCEEQISTVMQPSNGFSWIRIVEKFRFETIRSKIQEMMLTAHREVIQSDEFKDTERSEVEEYLRTLIQNGIHSDIGLEAVLNWIRHDASSRSVHMPELFGIVSVDKCTRSFLHKVVEENAELLESQQNIHKLILNDILIGDGKLEENLLVLGGQSFSDDPNNDCWLFKDDHLVKFAEVPGKELKPYHSMCQVPQGVMLTGGVGSDICKLFDVANNAWIDKANLLSKRSWHGSGCLNGKVFVIAGKLQTGSANLKSVDYMDLDMNTWQHGPDMPETEPLPKVTVCNSKLFVLLSRTGALYCLGGEGTSWTQKSRLPTVSNGCSMAAVHHWMFAAGGDTNINYMYTPTADAWCRLTGPSLCERQGTLVSFKEKLYLIAGCRRDRNLTDVEEYDISSDTWSLASWRLTNPLLLQGAFVVRVPR